MMSLEFIGFRFSFSVVAAVNGCRGRARHSVRAGLLPRRHAVEERAGERKCLFNGAPLSPALSPLVPRGERELARTERRASPFVLIHPRSRSPSNSTDPLAHRPRG